MSEFNVGDRVVCIDDSKPKDFKPHHFPNWVVQDETYHVRDILHNDDIVPGVLLREVINPMLFIPLINDIQEGAFRETRFSLLKSAQMIRETEEVDAETFKKWKEKKNKRYENNYINNAFVGSTHEPNT